MPRKGKSGRKLAQKLIADMREAFVAGLSLQQIATKFKVSRPTLTKYCREDRWQEYADRVRAKTREKTAEFDANANAKTVLLLQAYIAKQGKALAQTDKIDFSIMGLDKAARLVQLLTGEADSRDGGSLNSVDDIKKACAKLTTTEIRTALAAGDDGD